MMWRGFKVEVNNILNAMERREDEFKSRKFLYSIEQKSLSIFHTYESALSSRYLISNSQNDCCLGKVCFCVHEGRGRNLCVFKMKLICHVM